MSDEVVSRRSLLRKLTSVNDNDDFSLEEELRVVTDSLGRVVGTPECPSAAAPARPAVQEFLLAVAPQKTYALAYEPKRLAPKTRKGFERVKVGALFDRMAKGLDVSLRHSGVDLLVDIEDESDWAPKVAGNLESKTGVPLYTIRRGVSELPQTLKTLGDLLGVSRGEELSLYVTERLETLALAVESTRFLHKPRVLFCNEELEIDLGRGRRALQRELIELAGGIDLVSDSGLQKASASSQATLKASCDVVIAPNPETARSLLDAGDIRSLPWAPSNAVSLKQVYSLDMDGMDERNGMSILPWSVVGVRWLASVLHPGLLEFDLDAEASEFFDVFYPS